MKAEETFTGLSASAGYASGAIFLARQGHAGHYARKASAGAEYENLEQSIALAAEATARLMESAEDDAADILEFQLAMLGDDTFATAARPLIDGGMAADRAWSEVLDAEIKGYAESEEEYFRARAADLMDIRDRVLGILRGDSADVIPPGSIFVADDITPSHFLGHDWNDGGIALRKGSVTSHVAMLARQRGIPMIVGIGEKPVDSGSPALLDAVAGHLVLRPQAASHHAFLGRRRAHDDHTAFAAGFADKPARTADGYPVTVLVNIADPAETEAIDIAHVDGVGLMRTEFLYGNGLPDEEAQYLAYRKVAEWAKGKPVTIRTVDAGGDKPVAGFTESEANPFLGVRGIRLCLAKPEVFSVQVRALLRAAVFRNIKVMLPMLSVPEELEQARAIFEAELAALRDADVPAAMPELGIMVEVPAVAITPGRFERASFFSIGSNDLTQYVMAASRDSGALSYLAKTDDPAVMALIANVARHGAERGIPVSLCGDAASDPALLPALLAAGVTTLSVAAARIGVIKAAIASISIGTAHPVDETMEKAGAARGRG